MDYNKIENLLNRYLEGNTSLAEEKQLKDFFSENENVPENLQYGKLMFSAFKEEKTLEYKKQLPLPKAKNNKKFLYISGIAASLIFALFLTFSNIDTDNEKIIYAYYNGKPITDKTLAEKYTKETLLLISQNLNNGTKNLNKLSHFYKSQSKIKTK